MAADKRRYFEWNFEAGYWREYRRSGQCIHCGECCRAYIQYRTAPPPDHIDPAGFAGNGAPHSGIWYEITAKEGRFFIGEPIIVMPGDKICPSLCPETNLCAVHEAKNLALRSLVMCDLWPFHPSNTALFLKCGYTFELIAEGRIEDIENG